MLRRGRGRRSFASDPRTSLYQSASTLSPRQSQSPPPLRTKEESAAIWSSFRLETLARTTTLWLPSRCLAGSKFASVTTEASIKSFVSTEFLILASSNGVRASLRKSVSPLNHSSEGDPSTRRTPMRSNTVTEADLRSSSSRASLAPISMVTTVEPASVNL